MAKAQQEEQKATTPIKFNRTYRRKKDSTESREGNFAFQNTEVPYRLKRLARNDLTHETMKRIMLHIMTSKCSHRDAAIKFKVKPMLVFRLMKQFKADPSIFDQPTARQ